MHFRKKNAELVLIFTSAFLLLTDIIVLAWQLEQYTTGLFLIYRNMYVQTLIVLVIAFFLTFLLFVDNHSITVAVVCGKTLLLAFCCQAIGTQNWAFAFFLISLVIEICFFYEPPFSFFVAVCVFVFSLLCLRSHSTKDIYIEGISLYEGVFAFCFSLVSGAFVSVMMVQNKCMRILRAESERLEGTIKRISDTNLAYQNYVALIEEKSVEQERQRISREIHDIIGYTMTNVLMLIQAALHTKDDAKKREILEKAQVHLNTSVDEARLALRRMRERDMFEIHGANLFLQLTKTFSDVTGVTVTVDFANLTAKIGRSVEKAVYRFLQEGLTNSFRHGKATEVLVSFWRESEKLYVRLIDNGQSVSSEYIKEGIGIRGMRERIESLGGTLSAKTIKNGFSLSAEIPLGGKYE